MQPTHRISRYCHSMTYRLGPSINRLVTDQYTKLCCRGFILALFQSTTANKILIADSEYTRDYKRLLPVCEAETLRLTVKRIEVSHLYTSISDEFRLKLPKIAKRVPRSRFLADVHKDG